MIASTSVQPAFTAWCHGGSEGGVVDGTSDGPSERQGPSRCFPPLGNVAEGELGQLVSSAALVERPGHGNVWEVVVLGS